MSTKMKGLLKGLRYISQIFDEQDEPELQIGHPTDVKHVAHIGWDGPTTNAPSWINQFKNEGDSAAPTAPNAPLPDMQNAPKGREAQEKQGTFGPDSPLQSPSRRRSDKSKGSRRHSSASGVESPRRSSTSEQQSRTVKLPPGNDSPAGDSSKPSRRKKSKASSGKTSTKSKSAGQSGDGLAYSDPGVGRGQNRTTAGCQSSVLKSSEEDQKSLDDVSRGIHAL